MEVLDGVWHVRSLPLVRQVLREADATVQAGFSAETARQGLTGDHPPVLYADGPEHRRQRTATARFFTPAAVSRRYRALMEERADELVERIRQDGGAELSAITLRYSVEVAAQVVGLTNSDIDGMSRRLERFFSGPVTGSAGSPRRRLPARRRGEPDDQLRRVLALLAAVELLLAVVVLYVFNPSVANIVLILAITRIPIYLRTARAESAELQSRTFVDAARTFGARPNAIIGRHVIPVVLPTLLTLATLEFCYVMLAESSLSFLGIGIQPPDVSWGLMVAQGRQYLQTAWWLSIFPGLAIVITTIAANVLAAWLRIATDPAQRWRLALPRKRLIARIPVKTEESK